MATRKDSKRLSDLEIAHADDASGLIVLRTVTSISATKSKIFSKQPVLIYFKELENRFACWRYSKTFKRSRKKMSCVNKGKVCTFVSRNICKRSLIYLYEGSISISDLANPLGFTSPNLSAKLRRAS